VSGVELTALQLHGDKATQLAVEEEKIDEKLPFVNNHAVLIAYKAEFVTEGQNELLDIGDNSAFQHTLIRIVFIFNVDEVKKVLIFEGTYGAAGLFAFRQSL